MTCEDYNIQQGFCRWEVLLVGLVTIRRIKCVPYHSGICLAISHCWPTGVPRHVGCVHWNTPTGGDPVCDPPDERGAGAQRPCTVVSARLALQRAPAVTPASSDHPTRISAFSGAISEGACGAGRGAAATLASQSGVNALPRAEGGEAIPSLPSAPRPYAAATTGATRPARPGVPHLPLKRRVGAATLPPEGGSGGASHPRLPPILRLTTTARQLAPSPAAFLHWVNAPAEGAKPSLLPQL